MADEVRRLERARAALGEVLGTDSTSSARIAGPGAVEKVAATLARIGRTTQAEITRATGLNSGTVTHALRVLEAERPPRARRTGARFRGSAEWSSMGEVPVRRRRRRAA